MKDLTYQMFTQNILIISFLKAKRNFDSDLFEQ